jgi:hypothetical protein
MPFDSGCPWQTLIGLDSFQFKSLRNLAKGKTMKIAVAVICGLFVAFLWIGDPETAVWPGRIHSSLPGFFKLCLEWRPVTTVLALVIGLGAIMIRQKP